MPHGATVACCPFGHKPEGEVEAAAKKSASVGRYRIFPSGSVGPSAGRMPANGLGSPPARGPIKIAIASVDDPSEPGHRLLVASNRRVDILEHERARGLISEAAYREGRSVQAVFERAKGPGNSSNWDHYGAGRVDAYVSKELTIIKGVDTAARIGRLVRWLQFELGRLDTDIIRHMLVEGKTYSDVATMYGKAGERAISRIAYRFREALEQLATARSAVGKA